MTPNDGGRFRIQEWDLGGIVSMATRSIIAGAAEDLPKLLPDLVDFTLSPYLGAERAAQLAEGNGNRGRHG